MTVLVFTGILSALVFSTLSVINRNTERVNAKSWEIEITALAQKGIAIGTEPGLLRDDPLLTYTSEQGNEGYRVSINTEDTKIAINSVLGKKDKSLLRRLFTSWGIDDILAASITDALVDWTDPNDLKELNGAEQDYYRELGFTDRPYNRDFYTLEDMLKVKDFSAVAAVKPDWQDYFTLLGDGRLDINHTDIELLAVATEQDAVMVESYVEQVRGEDGLVGTEDDKPSESMEQALDALNVTSEKEARNRIRNRFILRGRILRVVSEGFINDTKKEISVWVRQSGRAKPTILRYEEKFTNQ